MMPKPVCVSCKRFFRPYRTGQHVLEQMPTTNYAPPGTLMESAWVPYKLWSADKYKCDGCGLEIVVGFGSQPYTEHYLPDFAAKLARVRDSAVVVNDC